MSREPTEAATHSAADLTSDGALSSHNLVAESWVTFDGPEDVAVSVVDVIARESGEPVTELVSRIDEAVDPDALNRIVRPLSDGTTRSGLVSFVLCGYLVRLHSDGHLQVFDGVEPDPPRIPDIPDQERDP